MEDTKKLETENTSPQAKEAIQQKPETAAEAAHEPKSKEEAKATEENEQQINWRKFREAREKERKEKQEAEKRAIEKESEVQALKAAMEALVNKPESNNRQTEEYSEETEDQRIARLVERSLEKERQKRQIEDQEKEQKEFPTRLTKEYPDFNNVCTSESLDYLEYHYPEVAEAYRHMPDGYNKWSAVYKAVKRFVPSTNVKQNQAIADRNLSKPQSMSIAGKTPTGDSAPQYLDDKRKADNWARMQRAMKGGA